MTTKKGNNIGNISIDGCKNGKADQKSDMDIFKPSIFLVKCLNVIGRCCLN